MAGMNLEMNMVIYEVLNSEENVEERALKIALPEREMKSEKA
jgi:hypothetical protein